MMRVLISTNIPSPYRWKFWNKLNEKCDVTVAFERTRAGNRNASWYSTEEGKFGAVYLKGIPYGDESSASPEMAGLFISGDYDVRVIGGYASISEMLAILALKLTKKDYIMDIDGAIEHEEPYLKRLIKRFFISGAKYYLSPSRVSDEYLVNYGADPGQIRRYHFTSLLKEEIAENVPAGEQKNALKNALGIPENKVVLSVGSFIHRKGFDILLKAFQNMPPDVGCYIVGGTPGSGYLSIAKECGLKNVHFVNHLGKEELLQYYRAADCLAFPTRYDIWGLVVNEAMSQGLPVITTNRCVSGLELIKDGMNGFIINTEDSQSLHDRMIRILEDEQLRKQMSAEALKTIQNYTIETMAEEYNAVFQECRGGN